MNLRPTEPTPDQRNCKKVPLPSTMRRDDDGKGRSLLPTHGVEGGGASRDVIISWLVSLDIVLSTWSRDFAHMLLPLQGFGANNNWSDGLRI